MATELMGKESKPEVKANGTYDANERKIILKALNGLAASILRAKTKDINDPELVAVRDKQLREISNLITKEMYHETK